MQKHIHSTRHYLFFFVFLCLTAQAQTTPSSVIPFCGTEDLTLEKARLLVNQAESARQQKLASGAAFQAITYVPIRPHIIRRSDGSGGFNLGSLNKVMASTNSYYLLNGFGIQFYFAGISPDYIDNDDMYNAYSSQPLDSYDAHNAMNQYYVNQFSNPGLGGFAYYPDNGVYSTRSVILTGGSESENDLGNRLIPHELGHSFNLIHTFGQNSGNGSLGSGTTTELVTRGAGANCATDGDLICDTPADPYNMVGASLTYPSPSGCPQYDPSSTARDANGSPFSPSITNIMSYYFPCAHDFTPGQYDRMQAGLALRQSHTAYTLDAPATDVSAPSNLVATQDGTTAIITWQDNASNEMGYFIERSTSPNSNFVPVSGVAPNVTTFIDYTPVLNTKYYYRIRPSNTTTGSLSPTVVIKISPPLDGLTTTNITGTSARLNWSIGNNIASYTLQYRIVGTPAWTTIPGVQGNTTTLTYLNVNTTYEWQIKATDADTYVGPVSFTTLCPVPSLYTTSPLRTSTSLGWFAGNPETYSLQWRALNASTWTTVDALTSTYYSLTGLTSSTTYEWRVQGTCPGSTTLVTDYSSPQSFTTQSCPIPTLRLNKLSSTVAMIYWYTAYFEMDRTFTIRYRVIGTPDWITLGGITTQEYSLTGLTTNTAYEVQIESVCSQSEHSGFSASLNITPSCQPTTYMYSSAKNSTATLVWNTSSAVEPGTTFELQYKPLSSVDWTTVSNIIAATGSSNTVYELTGLTSNTTYQWRVKAICPATNQSTYTAGTTFTTGCFAPTNPLYSFLSNTSVSFNWNAFVEPNTRFDIRYRSVGAVDWTTLNNLSLVDASTSFSYSLTGLTNNTSYEWQVRTVCSPPIIRPL
ncbi:hypothetical protein GO730_16635 [Spirosoma sp. HMF3257]|uniref:Fibronectin type-III domain-containing protein n=1 Tax=Spirosoma telluris TaxID=2183553 RepID=A0A327NKQ2_9BACT|nr:hypothetical protein [Spirosoma telluris]RAI75383.1 hypothetical protein HMF3257_16570 [Spirosoma telluris]